MTEKDLIKNIMHKLAKIDARMAKQDDLDDLHEQLFEQDELLKGLQDSIQELKVNLEMKYAESINSEDVLLRSVLDRQST
ncbi:hypothetical protein HXA34_16925 [Salipaludibacillus agaradhaerens]|uniref:hypothetical protein n=1 Tax=Salipaludibacillus agaradhaerens TaxID=76935 RepID=UPI00215170E4|nr:hypothetical protein [Salipaludibacillus agaradhaerens]MCR6107977.1 hypothetical protein [Salipaludibacillus agaradhaerens]MCR6120003.1 hypothetical protein [Salipaludibacillus agaradhaerens]UJW59053.1 hypothetical protein HXZ66_17385 [Bacillus sp. A116_S68]